MIDKKEIILMISLVLTLGLAWFKMWVEPNDEWRRTVIDCMDGDRSRAAYDNCVAMIKKTK